MEVEMEMEMEMTNAVRVFIFLAFGAVVLYCAFQGALVTFHYLTRRKSDKRYHSEFYEDDRS
jgi:hypothetical protein